MKDDELTEEVMDEPLVKGNIQALQVATRWMQERMASTSKRAQYASPEPLRRRRADQQGKMYAVGGYGGGHNLSSVECFDRETGAWEEVAPMNNIRQAVAAAVVVGRLYVGGGYDGSGTNLSSVEVYDPKTNVWKEVAPMSTARCGLAMVAMM